MRAILLTFVSFLITLVATAQNQHTQAIQQLMEAADIPGLSLAYLKNGEIRQLYHLGVRSADTRKPVDKETTFAAASLSKPAFAYGLMTLVESGQLDLDRPLCNYLEYKDLEHDEQYKKITTRMALSHTSGLPNWRRGDQLNFQYKPHRFADFRL